MPKVLPKLIAYFIKLLNMIFPIVQTAKNVYSIGICTNNDLCPPTGPNIANKSWVKYIIYITTHLWQSYMYVYGPPMKVQPKMWPKSK